MKPTFVELVNILERTADRCGLEGDLDINEIDDLLGLIPSYESDITPELAESCDKAINTIHDFIAVQMQNIIRSNGVIQQGRRALRGYKDTGLKSQPMRVYRNV